MHSFMHGYIITKLFSNREIVLVFDEMTIRESLVFDNSSGNVIRFVDVGDMNNKLKCFESNVKSQIFKKEVATHMLMMYVRGVFVKMEYPLAQFPTTGTCITCNTFVLHILYTCVYS